MRRQNRRRPSSPIAPYSAGEMWKKPVCSSDAAMRASASMKQEYFQCGTAKSAADLDSYQWLENLSAQAAVNQPEGAASLRRFRRLVDSALPRSQMYLLLK